MADSEEEPNRKTHGKGHDIKDAGYCHISHTHMVCSSYALTKSLQVT